MNMSPQEDRIGRSSKVGKETIFALLKALELFVNQDYDDVIKSYDERAEVITKAVEKFGVTRPAARVQSERAGQRDTALQLADRSVEGEHHRAGGHAPAAETKPVGIGSLNADAAGMRGRNPDAPANPPQHHRRQQDPTKFGFAVWQLKEGEDKYIADRLVEIFSAAPKS